MTIPIVERIREVRKYGDAYVEGLTVKARQRELENFARILQPVYSQFHAIVQIEGNLKKHGIVGLDENMFAQHRRLIRDLVKNDELDVAVLRSIGELGKTIEDLLISRWTAYLETTVGAVKNTVSLMSKIVGETQDIEKLTRLLAIVYQEKPATDRAMLCLAEYLTNANRIIDELQLNDNIRNFLINVTTRNATLAHMDQEVYDWLVSNDFAHRVRISF